MKYEISAVFTSVEDAEEAAKRIRDGVSNVYSIRLSKSEGDHFSRPVSYFESDAVDVPAAPYTGAGFSYPAGIPTLGYPGYPGVVIDPHIDDDDYENDSFRPETDFKRDCALFVTASDESLGKVESILRNAGGYSICRGRRAGR